MVYFLYLFSDKSGLEGTGDTAGDDIREIDIEKLTDVAYKQVPKFLGTA